MNVGQLLNAIKAHDPEEDLEVTVRVGDRCFTVNTTELVLVDEVPFILAIDCEEQDDSEVEADEEVEDDDETQEGDASDGDGD